MRTTLREKLLLWANGLALAIGIELLSRAPGGPGSAEALLIAGTVALVMAAATTLILRAR